MQKKNEMIITTDSGKVANIWKRSRVIKSYFLPRQQMLFISQANKLKLNPVIDKNISYHFQLLYPVQERMISLDPVLEHVEPARNFSGS